MSASRECSHSFAAADHFKCCCAEPMGTSARSPCLNTVSASSLDSARPKELACRKVVVRLLNISLFMSIAKPSAIRNRGRDSVKDAFTVSAGLRRCAESRKKRVAQCKRFDYFSKACRRSDQPLHGVTATVITEKEFCRGGRLCCTHRSLVLKALLAHGSNACLRSDKVQAPHASEQLDLS